MEMKAFEEWENEDCQNKECPELSCDECIYLRKEGWRAALVRVLDECHHYKNQEVIDWILRELEL